ncbi:hypothetical protein X777_01988 [Ooceraea biroi]|uniref:Uncharacterized protein n=1 Tax=Ooceraea biroi TaxID=2015173 RepID=A0A026WPR4_OOCBI|nr:hypothetical protein X777_01988 [Ooceraea biroi]
MYCRSVRALQTIISTRSSHKAQSEKLGDDELIHVVVTNEREKSLELRSIASDPRPVRGPY